MTTIKWIFFDIGSTLVDESECYKRRFEETTATTSISRDEFEKKTIEFAKQNLKGDHAAANFYHLSLSKWHSDLEMPYPEVESILLFLTAAGYKLGIIANQLPGTVSRLKQWGLLSYFDVVVASTEEGLSKPNEAIFKVALSKARCLAEEAMMVGDRLDNDIVPAKRLGMTTVWVKQGYSEYASPICPAEQPDFTIHSIADLPGILS